jgi:hypothetical protein
VSDNVSHPYKTTGKITVTVRENWRKLHEEELPSSDTGDKMRIQ